VLVPRYKLSLCQTLIKPDTIQERSNSDFDVKCIIVQFHGVFACGLRDHVITRFASKFPWNLVSLRVGCLTSCLRGSHKSLNY